ncbi:MAG TPA: hypothetical protein VIB39_19650 [Candidatus Angelobacter sp.]|jgi:hypothetical protein
MKIQNIGLLGLTVSTALLLVSCSKGVKGTYACSGGIFLKSITLDSDDKALVTGNVFGSTQQKNGTYSVKGDVVTITVDGSPTPFIYKDKTLDGGELGGRCIAE